MTQLDTSSLDSSHCLLATIPEAERNKALNRFQILRPFLEDDISLTELAREAEIPLRTARRWVADYRANGLSGLVRKRREDKGRHRISKHYQETIEGLALQRPRLSAAAIHRRSVAIADKLGEQPLSYSSVYALIRMLEPGLLTLAHEGAKSYSDSFDLIHRYTASSSNAIWQADHTELDIWIKDERGQPGKPWLTIILDDYSRTVAGYLLSFSSPSALQTSLALRQAIWRKEQPGWQICGIPQVLYTDHGSDFTSQHIEQVAAELKMRLMFSTVGKPRGRGKIERFFKSLSQIFLSRLPGYTPSGKPQKAVLDLATLTTELEHYIIEEYHTTPHRSTGGAPQTRWASGGFLPQMPDSLEQLDLLLLSVPKTRRVRQDGIHFMRMRYIDPTLAAYVGEEVVLRYDPRDVTEIRIFLHGHFLCRAVCQELAGETVSLREIKHARNRRRRDLRQTVEERQRTVDALLEARRWSDTDVEENHQSSEPKQQPVKLKRYYSE